MKKEELVKGLYNRLIEQGTSTYREEFFKAEITTRSDTYAVEAIDFFKSLSNEQKETFFKIVRQIRIDTTASFFSFLDGSFWIEGQTEDMKLVNLENPGEKLNEDLTDLFLNLIHTWKR